MSTFIQIFILFPPIVLIIIAFIYLLRYTKFLLTEYVLKIRKNKIISVSKGGAFIRKPLTRYVSIPATIQRTHVDYEEDLRTMDSKRILISVEILWAVDDTETAFTFYSWETEGYVEDQLSRYALVGIRKACVLIQSLQINDKINEISSSMMNEIHSEVINHGITIKSADIISYKLIK